MVPLVKKQMSIDEKIMEDDEDEGFGDSMKTIKRGQGSSLARSLSLKLSPKTDQQKPIGADTEVSAFFKYLKIYNTGTFHLDYNFCFYGIRFFKK